MPVSRRGQKMPAERPRLHLSPAMKLPIIIPVYNEEQTINEVLERVSAVDLGDLEKEIIIANDGSTDDTRRNIDASLLTRGNRVRV